MKTRTKKKRTKKKEETEPVCKLQLSRLVSPHHRECPPLVGLVLKLRVSIIAIRGLL